MFFNLKEDIKTFKEFWENFKRRAPLLASFIKILFIITKWLVFLAVLCFLVILPIIFYRNIQRSKERAEFERRLGEAQINYQKCLDKTTKIETLAQEWKNMRGWKEWRCGANWELFWVDWILSKYPELCSEYNLDSIRFFLKYRLGIAATEAKLQKCPP